MVDAGYRGMTLDQLLVGGPDEVGSALTELAAAGFET